MKGHSKILWAAYLIPSKEATNQDISPPLKNDNEIGWSWTGKYQKNKNSIQQS